MGALVAALAVGGIAWFAMSMDGPVEPANKAAVVKARKNYLRLARNYRSGYRHYESRKRWAGQMNSVCFVLQRRLRVVDVRFYRVGRLRSVVALLRQAEEQVNAAFARMRRLRPPPADRPRVRRMFVLYARTMSDIHAMIDALERRDFRTIARVSWKWTGLGGKPTALPPRSERGSARGTSTSLSPR